MNVVRDIADGRIPFETYLGPGRTEPLYDPFALERARQTGDTLEIRGQIPFMPLTLYDGETKIPLFDYEAQFRHHMGLLIDRSRALKDLFVVRFLPHPADTPYPTRLITNFQPKTPPQPITGFIVRGQRGRRGKKEIALVHGQEAVPTHIGFLPWRHGGPVVASVVLSSCASAENKNRNRLSKKTAV